ncbi:MAG: VPEID-CTERM sorting domain-containing protein [Rhodobacteraceae bacterium]|nr:VPEID-CTERM sorting domain-containing protein [Paracoccaceae bacterium]
MQTLLIRLSIAAAPLMLLADPALAQLLNRRPRVVPEIDASTGLLAAAAVLAALAFVWEVRRRRARAVHA